MRGRGTAGPAAICADGKMRDEVLEYSSQFSFSETLYLFRNPYYFLKMPTVTPRKCFRTHSALLSGVPAASTMPLAKGSMRSHDMGFHRGHDIQGLDRPWTRPCRPRNGVALRSKVWLKLALFELPDDACHCHPETWASAHAKRRQVPPSACHLRRRHHLTESQEQGFLVALEWQRVTLRRPLSKETLNSRTCDLVNNNLNNNLHFHNINAFQSNFTEISSFNPHNPVNNTFYVINAIYKETESQKCGMIVQFCSQ